MATTRRTSTQRDYGPERLVKSEDVNITRWQLIAEKIRDAFTATRISNRCMLVYEALQLLEPEELESLDITQKDIEQIEDDYRGFRFSEMDLTFRSRSPLSEVTCKDGTTYGIVEGPEGMVKSAHDALKRRLVAERNLGKIIRSVVKHAEGLGIKVTSISVSIPGPGGAVFGRTRMVGAMQQREENDES